MSRLDRRLLRMSPLAERKHELNIEQIAIHPGDPAPPLPEKQAAQVMAAAERIASARRADRPVMLTYGAHLIKNGLGPVVIHLMREGWITHAATNGAGSIHDWEFAFAGMSSEDVRVNAARGKFGAWEETGRNINLALAVGSLADLGYGWSVGKMITEDGLPIPSEDELRAGIAGITPGQVSSEQLGALSDMLYLVSNFGLPPGWMEVSHRFKQYSVQCAAFQSGVPLTVHPGIGYDIIYTHPMNCGGAIGRGAVRDFLTYADSVSRLDGGVHLSVGSAVMSPMIFEKALSMANNLSLQQKGQPLSDYYLAVVDIQESADWDWTQGEPPADHPAYYLRFCKTFYRMGGTLDYICLDNRQFMLGLCSALCSPESARI